MNKPLSSLIIASILSGGILVLASTLPPSALAQNSDSGNGASANTSALLTRHQQRMDILEQGLKEIRGVVERDFREIKMKLEQLGSSSAQAGTSQIADLAAMRNEIEKISDRLQMTSRRMERTLEITSDTEFRLLRLEKRVQTLVSLGGDEAAAAAVQQESSPADAPVKVEMTRERNSGVTKWSVDEKSLNRELAENQPPSQDADTSAGTSPDTPVPAPASSDSQAQLEPEVLPAVGPEEQYRFALGRALQNDLETAERAFDEFRNFNKGHEREADAVFWLGRVQFMRGEYEKAAMTFSEFNNAYPGDARLVDTTLWIAESVSHFAPPEQACEIYASLPQLLDAPPETFTATLAELSDAAKCNS